MRAWRFVTAISPISPSGRRHTQDSMACCWISACRRRNWTMRERGFSFRTDAPLDMRMDPTSGESAAEFLARASEAEIADVLWKFGEERMSRRIARTIVERRATDPIARTGELAGLVARVVGRPPSGKHPATRTFQALRIAVNGELDALDRGLQGALARLRPGGRLVVISFHSLEDRAVKQFMRDKSSCRRRGAVCRRRPMSSCR